jgi:WD40 repeat protein
MSQQTSLKVLIVTIVVSSLFFSLPKMSGGQSGRNKSTGPVKPVEKPEVVIPAELPKRPVSELSIKQKSVLTDPKGKTRYEQFSLSPDGHSLAVQALNAGYVIRLWDLNTIQIKADLPVEFLSLVSFSPDCRTIVTASLGKHPTRLWDAATGKLRASLPVHHAPVVWRTSFTADSRILATAEFRQPFIYLWDTETGALRKTLQHPDMLGSEDRDYVGEIVFSPVGNTLASISDKLTRTYLWDIQTGEIIKALIDRNLGSPAVTHLRIILDMRFSPDGRLLATSSSDSTAKLWDVATHELTVKLPHQSGDVYPAIFSPDGRTIATGNKGVVQIWGVDKGELQAAFTGFNGDPNLVIYSPDGRLLVTGADKDKEIKVWDIVSHQLVATLPNASRPAAFTPDGKTLITESVDHNIILWSVEYK